MHGQFVWYELTTSDVAGARKFYPQFTGWGTQQFDENYLMWTVNGMPIAGLFNLGAEQREKGVRPNWMPYVGVDNVDEASRKAARLGGKVVHAPEEIPNTGRFAVLQDPQGATFGVYTSKTSMTSAGGKPEVGRFTWHELMTTDYTRAFEFYRQLFGWQQTGVEDMGGGAAYALFGLGGNHFGGMYNRPAEMASMPPFWMLYIYVNDMGKAVETATKAGAWVKQPPTKVFGGGTIAILGDPEGVGFALFTAGASSSEVKAKTASRPKTRTSASKRKTTGSTKKKAAAKTKTAGRKATAKKKRSKR